MDAIVVTDHDKPSIAPEADRHQGIIIVIEQHRIDILYTTVEKSATVPAVRTQAWETSIPVDIDNDRRSMMPAAMPIPGFTVFIVVHGSAPVFAMIPMVTKLIAWRRIILAAMM